MTIKTKAKSTLPSVQYSPLHNFPHKRLHYYPRLYAFIPKSLFLQRHSTKVQEFLPFFAFATW